MITLDEAALARFVDERVRAALAEHGSTGWVRRDRAGVEVRTLRAWIASGEVAAAKVGRTWMVKLSDVATTIERRRVERDDKPEEFKDVVDRGLERRRLRVVGGRSR